MKIATFNINNVNRRLPNLLRWLRAAKPDVVALQELKATDAAFPAAAIDKAGYGAVWRGQKTWNGVAILARNADPVLVRNQLPGDADDREARYIEAAVGGIIVTSIYLPNGNPQLALSGAAGQSYTIERTGSLANPSWSDVGTVVLEATGHATFEDTQAGKVFPLFYRATAR